MREFVYFQPLQDSITRVLLLVKGNVRRNIVENSARASGQGSIGAEWLQHDLPEDLKSALQARHPQARGGEDLPDCQEQEVEIARLTLVDSVHGEVTSLRAQRIHDGFVLRIVDEWNTRFTIKSGPYTKELLPEEVIEIFKTAEPSPMETHCAYEFQSYFYANLQEIVQRRFGERDFECDNDRNGEDADYAIYGDSDIGDESAMACATLENMLSLVSLLQDRIAVSEEDNGSSASEVITFILLNGIQSFGTDSQVMEELFPAMNSVKRQIDDGKYAAAALAAVALANALQEMHVLHSRRDQT